MKLIMIALMIVGSIASIRAASPTEHVVERGETIASIAKKYNVSEQALIEANPDAASYTYAGMVLTIPAYENGDSDVSSQTDSNRNSEDDNSNNSVRSSQMVGSTSVHHSQSVESDANKQVTAKDFSNVSLTYSTSFKSFEHGAYGFVGDGYQDSGMGFNIGLSASFGLTDPGSLIVYFGPQYGYVISDYFMPSIKLKGYVSTTEIVTGNITTSIDSHEETSIVCGGGIYFTPTLNFRFGKFVIGIGYDLGFFSIKYERKQSTTFSHMLELQIGMHF